MNFDLIVIGSGQAGVPLATALSKRGKRVLVVERSAPGGTCVNYGCTPTKTMIASARAAHVARTAARLGVQTGEVRVDFAAVVARKDAMVRQWREGVAKRLNGAGPGLQFIAGHARFVGPREIEVAGERHTAESVVINVGARPLVPPLPGLDQVAFLDSSSALDLRELPPRLIVLGGGYIGCELGQMFRRFGSEVTIVDASQRLLSREDPEISAEVEKVFREEGIVLRLGGPVREVSTAGAGIRVVLSDGDSVEGTHLLVATGRRPNSDDLGCEAAGIALDEHGFIRADDQYRTTRPNVFAVGDVIAQPQFTHTSWDDHRLLLGVLAGQVGRDRTGRIIPHTTFTDPQVAGVGLTEDEAKRRRIAYEAATMPFGNVARAIEVGETAGILKVLVDPHTEQIIGAAIVGAEAGELIHIFVALMQAKASARALVEAQVVHPTFAEGLQSVLMRLKRFAP